MTMTALDEGATELVIGNTRARVRASERDSTLADYRTDHPDNHGDQDKQSQKPADACAPDFYGVGRIRIAGRKVALGPFDDRYASGSGFAIDPFDNASRFRIGLMLSIVFRHEDTLFAFNGLA
jgi:hypothetical protein